MRVREKNGGVSAFAVAGTYVVTIGFDVTAARRDGLLGFSLHRTDHTENESYWLPGYKVFDLPGRVAEPGDLVRTSTTRSRTSSGATTPPSPGTSTPTGSSRSTARRGRWSPAPRWN